MVDRAAHRNARCRHPRPDLASELTTHVVAAIRAALLGFRVVFFRDQDISPTQQVQFARRFGELTPSHPLLGGLDDNHPEVLVLDSRDYPLGVRTRANGTSYNNRWHTDVTFSQRPPMGTVLAAREIPPRGGDTLWADHIDAYETLSASIQQLITGLTAVHRAGGTFDRFRNDDPTDDQQRRLAALTPVQHSVVRIHPETGERGLFVNETFTQSIVGLAPTESDAILQMLCADTVEPSASCAGSGATATLLFGTTAALLTMQLLTTASTQGRCIASPSWVIRPRVSTCSEGLSSAHGCCRNPRFGWRRSTIERMEFAWTSEQIELRERARTVATDAVARFGRHNDSWINGYSKDFAKEMASHGWIGMTWPSEFGGGARPAIERLIVGEELIKAGAPIAAMWFADRQMGPTLIAYGRPDQQTEFLPKILSGETTWCIGMSEPNAGSDLAGLTTSAVRDRDDWVINGQKIWTSFGEVADYCYLICRTTKAGPPHAGISEIIVPMDTPGIDVRPIKDMTTNRHFCEVFFTDVRVPVINLVGTEGAAFKQTMRQLEHERGGIDRLVSNHALYLLARDRADTTDALVRQDIAALEIAYRIGRILVIREALRQAPAGFSAATKCFCTEHEVRVADFVSRVLGAEATLWNEVTQGLSYAPGYTIMGGTSNVMRNILGERVLGLPR